MEEPLSVSPWWEAAATPASVLELQAGQKLEWGHFCNKNGSVTSLTDVILDKKWKTNIGFDFELRLR